MNTAGDYAEILYRPGTLLGMRWACGRSRPHPFVEPPIIIRIISQVSDCFEQIQGSQDRSYGHTIISGPHGTNGGARGRAWTVTIKFAKLPVQLNADPEKFDAGYHRSLPSQSVVCCEGHRMTQASGTAFKWTGTGQRPRVSGTSGPWMVGG